MESNFFASLRKGIDLRRKCRVVVPLAQDEACAYAVSRGIKEGLLKGILLGNSNEIREMYGELADSPDISIMDSPDSSQACKTAVSMIKNDEADIVMKGLVSTAILFKAVLHSGEGIKKNGLLSHLCFFEHPKKTGVKILTDSAINIAPDAEALVQIVENAVEAYSVFFKDPPKVALLSANEKVSDKVPSTGLAKKVSDFLRNRSDMVVEGPISLDLAVSLESVRIKNYQGRIKGDADIFVVPRIETGNAFYKILQYLVKTPMAGVVYGAKCPVVLTSRSDSNDTKFFSLLLGVGLWGKRFA